MCYTGINKFFEKVKSQLPSIHVYVYDDNYRCVCTISYIGPIS